MSAVLKLRRFLEAPRQPVPARAEVCEMCGAPLRGEHAHIVDVENRRLICTCRPCHLLFTNPGAAHGKFRAVSRRYLPLTDCPFNEGLWTSLEIPVGIAFFLRNSAAGRVLAFYPSPAGATESGLPLEIWEEMVETNPVLSTLEPDVEALLISQRSGHAWIVPVDACYELVGRIRRHWRGFEGGEEAWLEIEAFFAGLPARADEGES